MLRRGQTFYLAVQAKGAGGGGGGTGAVRPGQGQDQDRLSVRCAIKGRFSCLIHPDCWDRSSGQVGSVPKGTKAVLEVSNKQRPGQGQVGVGRHRAQEGGEQHHPAGAVVEVNSITEQHLLCGSMECRSEKGLKMSCRCK